ncbi:class I adenylate-forming enzyme family protein [Polaromonas sp.]|uniref:class I adenylate-forming enzyme family protein n=1 Tax=Polaromonas sp. TaxID=1869339 RepID=UPI003BAA0439
MHDIVATESLNGPEHLAKDMRKTLINSAENDVIGDWVDAHAYNFPDRDAIVFEDMAISYGQLKIHVDQCAQRLLDCGLVAGDCIAVLCTPRPEAFISFLAAARIGALWLGLNPRYQMPELDYVLGDSRPRLLMSLDTLEGRDYVGDIRALAKKHPYVETIVMMQRHPGGRSSFYDWIDREYLTSSVAPGGPETERRVVDAAMPALLVYTSGSSGKPKGVLLSHRSLIRRSLTQNEKFPSITWPQVLNPLPVNHIGGMHFMGLFAFIGGGTIHYSERFSASEFVRALETGRINILILLPTMFKMMVDQPGFVPSLLSKLEWFVFSGAAMAPELLEMIRLSGCPLGLTYGMTETCGSVTYSDPDASLEVLANTIGRAVPDGEARVADALGVLTSHGVAGELQINPLHAMSGYFKREQATRDAYTPDGWLRTGDTAIMRTDGNIRFIGRSSEMFKSGGYNVYPREVELAIETLDAVVLSAVVSVPDPLFDEVGWAYVVIAAGRQITETELSSWCKSQLANYKVPKRFILKTELPLLPVGKVDKVTLKKIAIGEQMN